MAAKETAFFRGEGGAVIEMDLPLGEVMQDKVTRGTLRRVNEDGTPYREPAEEGAEEVVEEPQVPRPAVNASKAEWVGYAVEALGMNADDAEAATKQDLIDLANQQ